MVKNIVVYRYFSKNKNNSFNKNIKDSKDKQLKRKLVVFCKAVIFFITLVSHIVFILRKI